MPKTAIASVASNSTYGGSVVKNVASGDFKFKDYERTLDFIKDFEDMRERTGILPKASLITAMGKVYELKNFSMERFVKKSIQTDAKKELNTQSYKETDTLKRVLDVYNHKLSPESPLYIDFVINSSGKLKIIK